MNPAQAAWIQTYTNRKFFILDPRPDDICIEDIAHALAFQCRFTGHCRFHYSVAQHSIYVSQLVSSSVAMEGLLHDASEAYICDMSRPLKHFTAAGEEYLKVESVIEKAIARKFGLHHPMLPEIRVADNAMLYTEKSQLMPPMEWDTRWSPTQEMAQIHIEKWTPEEAEGRFLRRYEELQEISI